jgi:hypothetical protein
MTRTVRYSNHHDAIFVYLVENQVTSLYKKAQVLAEVGPCGSDQRIAGQQDPRPVRSGRAHHPRHVHCPERCSARFRADRHRLVASERRLANQSAALSRACSSALRRRASCLTSSMLPNRPGSLETPSSQSRHSASRSVGFSSRRSRHSRSASPMTSPCEAYSPVSTACRRSSARAGCRLICISERTNALPPTNRRYHASLWN